MQPATAFDASNSSTESASASPEDRHDIPANAVRPVIRVTTRTEVVTARVPIGASV